MQKNHKNNQSMLAIIQIYKVYKRKIAYHEGRVLKNKQLGLIVSENNGLSEEVLNAMREVIYLVDQALLSLDDNKRMIIEKEFINKSNYNWWIEKFSRSTYYRERKEAIRLFLVKLNNRKEG